MKITGISVYGVDLPLHEGSYHWSGGKSVAVFDSTIVAVHTDADVTGWGEVCPLGPYYLPAYAAGVRAGLQQLGPSLLGWDPRELDMLNGHMDRVLKGHPYVKSGVDMACWDLLGKITDQPVCRLLGGFQAEDFVLYRAISQEDAAQMAAKVAAYKAEGYTRFQLKVGAGVEEDIARIRSVRQVLDPSDILIADANTGWLRHEAIRVARGVKDVDVYMEQPCVSYEECLDVRRQIEHPFILDEVMDSVNMLVRATSDGALDVVNLKISKFGGITRTRQMRDLCLHLGVAMTIEDSWGGDIVTAAIAALAHSTPPEFLFTATDFNSYVTQSIATGAPQRVHGRMAAVDAPGLGVEPRLEVLGEPMMYIA